MLLRAIVIGVLFFLVLRLVRRAMEASRRASPRSGERPTPSDLGQPNSSPYEVLQVRPGASQAEITAAYRRLVQQYHPDKVANLAPEFREVAERRMKEINGAYERLSRHSTS